ncbi:MAG: DNA repair protein RecO [bacterium]|nr:DNA repair protein RecO [bacterium]
MIETRFEGILIGYENWGDADRLVSFYTREYGKIQAVAKGIRYEKSKLKGHLELLTHGRFTIVRRTGRGVVIDALALGTFDAVRLRPQIAYAARMVAEMYDRYLFTHAFDHGLWELLENTLTALAEEASARSGEEAVHEKLQSFSRGFLQALGYYDESAEMLSVKDTLSRYDALLAHTDLAGPGFGEMHSGLEALSK